MRRMSENIKVRTGRLRVGLFCALLALPALMAGCGDAQTLLYKPEQIQTFEAEAAETGVTVLIRPAMETFYYLAGAEIVLDGQGAATLRLLRCRIGKICKAAYPAWPVKDRAGFYRLHLPPLADEAGYMLEHPLGR